MRVEPIHKNRSVRRVSIDELLRGQGRAGPALMVPVTARDPPSGRTGFGKAADAFREFLPAVRVAQVNTRKLKTSREEMHVRIVKTGEHEPSPCIYRSRPRPYAQPNLFGCSHRHNSVAQDGDSLCYRMVVIHRSHIAIEQNNVGHNRSSRLGNHSSHKNQKYVAADVRRRIFIINRIPPPHLGGYGVLAN